MSDFIRNTPLPGDVGFKGWSDRFKNRQEQFPEVNNLFSFGFMGPTLINMISDLHVGHPTTNYGRIEDEAEAIVSTANSFLILVGDEIDNMGWNPGQFGEMEQTPEQISYFRALLQFFADNNKLLHRISGDHDGWLMKAGFDLQAEIPTRYKSSISQGVTFFEMDVDQTKYKLMGAHQLPGMSMYSKEHPQKRAERFGVGRGSDVIFSGHNHRKGHAEDYTHEWPGKPHLVHYIALGPYKGTDSWLAKKGYPPQQPEEMFGSSICIKPGKKEIIYFDNIVEANKKLKSGRR